MTPEDATAKRAAAPSPAPAETAVYAGGRPRLGPALVIVAIAVGITAGGAILGFVTTSGPAPAGAQQGSLVAGSGLRAEPAATALKRITTDGQPPSDILSVLSVPSSAKVSGSHFLGGGVDLYDADVELSVPTTSDKVLSFYRTELAKFGWSQRSSSPAGNGPGTELLGRRASNDGYYWEVGVIVRPASASVSPALGGADVAPTSSVEVRLFEVADVE